MNTHHIPENPRLASVFFIGGFIEALGRGTLKIVKEWVKYGLPEPDIEIMTDGIAVIIYKNYYSEKVLKKYNLNNRQSEILQLWKEKDEIKTRLYKDYFKITDSAL